MEFIFGAILGGLLFGGSKRQPTQLEEQIWMVKMNICRMKGCIYASLEAPPCPWHMPKKVAKR